MTTVGQVHRFNVGDFRCVVIADSVGSVTLNDMVALFNSVPAEEVEHGLKQHGFPLDGFPSGINILVIQTPEHRVLVDTGFGVGRSQLPDHLRAAGIEPRDIDRVILTHGHQDHVGGIVDEQGRLVYRNARYTMWKSEWEYWFDQAQKAADPQDLLRRNLPPIQDLVDLIDTETEIVPGISAVSTPGHTVGHMAVLIESAGERLLEIADVSNRAVQVYFPHWSPHFDADPVAAAETRKRVFERAADENLPLIAYHYPFPARFRVVRQGGGLAWQPITEGAGT